MVCFDITIIIIIIIVNKDHSRKKTLHVKNGQTEMDYTEETTTMKILWTFSNLFKQTAKLDIRDGVGHTH